MTSTKQRIDKMLGFIFAGGLIIHILYIFALLQICPINNWNWAHADTGTYTNPAQAFLHTGGFSRQGEPDCKRTVGYPFILSRAITLGEILNTDWRLVLYVMQAFLFAFMYPAIYFIGREVMGLTRSFALASVAFMVVSGELISYVTIILSDATFTTLLIVGIACGFNAVRLRSIGWSVLHIALVICAATVRPLLAFYPFAALCIHLAYVESRSTYNSSNFRAIILLMFFSTLVGVQSPAIRNWIHYEVFTPSEISSMNLWDYLAKDILVMKGQTDRYAKVQAKLHNLNNRKDMQERISTRKSEAMNVFREYPAETFALLTFNTTMNTLETHWNNTLCYLFRQTWYKDYGTVKQRPLPFMIALIFIAIYGFVYICAGLQAIITRNRTMIVISVIIFLLPYAICATSYQGARFRLWFEPFVILAAATTLQRVFYACATPDSQARRDSSK